MVANAVDLDKLGQRAVAHLLAELGIGGEAGDVQRTLVPGRIVVNKHFLAGRCAPDVRTSGLAASAMVVVIDAAVLQDLGHVGVVAEGIRLIIDAQCVGINVKQLGKIVLGVQNVTRQRLTVGHVFVGLNPRGGSQLPATLVHALLDLGEKCRVVLLDDLIYSRLRLREGVVGIVAHQIEHSAEGLSGDGNGLHVAPGPVHVNMGVCDAVDGQGLGLGRELREHLLDVVAVLADDGAVDVQAIAKICGSGAQLTLPTQLARAVEMVQIQKLRIQSLGVAVGAADGLQALEHIHQFHGV